jgi:hypothetical protein
MADHDRTQSDIRLAPATKNPWSTSPPSLPSPPSPPSPGDLRHGGRLQSTGQIEVAGRYRNLLLDNGFTDVTAEVHTGPAPSEFSGLVGADSYLERRIP